MYTQQHSVTDACDLRFDKKVCSIFDLLRYSFEFIQLHVFIG